MTQTVTDTRAEIPAGAAVFSRAHPLERRASETGGRDWDEMVAFA